MSCQQNSETYAIVIRCTLKQGALSKTLAEASGKTICVLMGEKGKEPLVKSRTDLIYYLHDTLGNYLRCSQAGA